MTRLGSVLDPAEFSPAESSALRLDGELFPLGDALVTVDALDSPALRARAALGGHPRRLIAELDTAAWIWGARDSLPARREFAATIDGRVRLAPGAPDRVRQVVVPDDDLADLDGVRVTTPVRTAVELARLRDDDEFEPQVVARLLRRAGRDAALRALATRVHPTFAQRARRRLRALPGPAQPFETR